MRVATGLCIAGCYTVIEAWMQAKLTNDIRGRAMGTYRVVDMGGSLVAQLMIGVLAPASYVSYNLLAILCCASLLPLALTRAAQPETPSTPRLRPMLAVARSPLAAAGVVVAGLTSGAFRMVGPIYGQEMGLPAGQLGFFLAAYVLGGALAQYPAGWLADKFDRRRVLIGFSAASVLVCGVTVAVGRVSPAGIMLMAGVFGMTSFPIFSISSAHAHDFAKSSERVELSAALMFFYALGAIASPLISSNLIAHFMPAALFFFLAFAHIVLVGYGLMRMRSRPGAATRTNYVYAPRTSFLIGRLMGKQRDRRN